MNRTLLDKIRCILFTYGLPKSFWGEVLCSAVYLVNRSSSSAIKFKCPKEIWTNRKPDLKHLRVVGCEAYSHKFDGKLELRSTRCVFLGYQEGTKGYRLWDRDSGGVRIIVSRDVIFNELVFPCRITNNDAGTIRANSEDLNFTGGAQFEVELEAGQPNQRLVQNTEPEPVNDSQEDSVQEVQTEGEIVQEDEENEHQEQPLPEGNLRNYQLSRDRERREIRPPAKNFLLT